MLYEDQVQRGVRVRLPADLPHIQVRAGIVGEIVQIRCDSRPDSWGFWIAWWASPSRTKTSLRLTREDLQHLELAGEDAEPHEPEASHAPAPSADRFPSSGGLP